MSNDVIKIDIDRSILDEYIAQLDSAIVGGRGGGGTGVSGGRGIGQPKTTMWKQSITNRNLQRYNQFMSWQTRPEWLDYNTLKTLQGFKGTTYNLPKNFSNFMELNQQLLKMPNMQARFVAAANGYYGMNRMISSPVDNMGFARMPQQAQQQVMKKGIKNAILGLDIPSVSREQRMVLNQLGFPTRAFYNAKRFQRGVAAGLISSPVGIFALATIIIMAYDQIRRIQRNLEQKENEYKNIFLEYKPDMTNREFQKLKDESHDMWGKMMNYVFRGK